MLVSDSKSISQSAISLAILANRSLHNYYSVILAFLQHLLSAVVNRSLYIGDVGSCDSAFIIIVSMNILII